MRIFRPREAKVAGSKGRKEQCKEGCFSPSPQRPEPAVAAQGISLVSGPNWQVITDKATRKVGST
jgi:hypothetical protein